uniref:Uncharacterized protein n=1 Tax=Anguilla anguilla TaxID=7936 RepID=A0A0E9W3N6_ANGAN
MGLQKSATQAEFWLKENSFSQSNPAKEHNHNANLSERKMLFSQIK